jgi:hypothetical protein
MTIGTDKCVRTTRSYPLGNENKLSRNFTVGLTTTGTGGYDRTGRPYRGKKHTKSNVYEKQVRKIQIQTQKQGF